MGCCPQRKILIRPANETKGADLKIGHYRCGAFS
jgi:hypothetical protein